MGVGGGGLLRWLLGKVVVVAVRLGVELGRDGVGGEVVGMEGGCWTGGAVGILVVVEGGGSAPAEAEVAIDGDRAEGVVGRDLHLHLGVVRMHGVSVCGRGLGMNGRESKVDGGLGSGY